MRLKWRVEGTGNKMNAYRVSVGKPEGKSPPGRLRRGFEDNIKLILEK
jgi:hypothetical protein